MNTEQVRDYTLSLYDVTEDQPFGDDILTFRLEGKIYTLHTCEETGESGDFGEMELFGDLGDAHRSLAQ
jgi:hypothetical protein